MRSLLFATILVLTGAGASLDANEAPCDVGSVTLRIPSPGDVDVVVTGYKDATKTLVMWTGAGVVRSGESNPDLSVVVLSAGPGLAYASTLSSLFVTPGRLVPDFSSTTTAYFDTVDNSVDHVTVSGAATDPQGNVQYSLDGNTFGTTNSFSLEAGTPKVIAVKSTNAGGNSPTYYSVLLYRKPASAAAKPRHALTASATNGSIALDPPGAVYDSGTSVTATATPNGGYVFSGWSGACANATGACTVVMTGEKSLTASFAVATVAHDSTLATFTLNGTTVKGFVGGVAGAGSRSYDDTVAAGSATATLGATVTESGSKVSGTGVVVLSSTGPTEKTVTVANANGHTLAYTIRIHRRQSPSNLPKYDLTTSATNGSIKLAPSGGTYDSGTSVTATATPDSGYVFSRWSGACSHTSATCMFNVTGPKILTAIFTEAPWNTISERLLSSYEVVATDSVQARASYGIKMWHNAASTVELLVPGGYMSLKASRIASDGTAGYTANIGISQPLDSSWSEHDLRGLRSITFEYRNKTAITDNLGVTITSGTYLKEYESGGLMYEVALATAADKAASTTWKSASIDVLEFAPPKWWTDIPAEYPKLDDVLARARAISFSPKTAYTGSGTNNGTVCTRCVTPTMTSQVLDIRNIKLHFDSP